VFAVGCVRDLGSSLFSVDFCRQDNRWKQRRVRSRVLLGNSRYTVTYVEAQALTHFRAVTLAVTLRYISLHLRMAGIPASGSGHSREEIHPS
jgi:hypothetical protein